MGGEKPKRPISGYFRYVAEIREDTRNANLDIPYPEVTKMFGAKWNAMPEDEKDVYNKRYRDEVEPYKEALREWEEENGVDKDAKKVRAKSKATKEQRRSEDMEESEKPKKPKGKKTANSGKDEKKARGGSKSKDKAPAKKAGKVSKKEDGDKAEKVEKPKKVAKKEKAK